MNTPTTYTQDDTISTSVNTLEAPLIGDMKQDEHGEVYVYTGSEWRRVVTPESDTTAVLLEAIRQCESWKREREDYYDVGYNEAIDNCCRVLKNLIK